jgi:sortase (surface protein transpeptidase)
VLITQKFASCKDSGIEMNVCVSCEEILEQFTIPQTDHIEVRGDMVNSTCISKGYVKYNCVKCGSTIRTKELSTTEHNYTTTTTRNATPIEDGCIIKKCKVCNKQITESIKWQNKYTNGIYIPKLNLYTNLTLGICNQEYTDKYDIICDYNFINENNPVLFGHNTRSLGSIYKLNSGDEIYIIRNGNVEAYRITVSELGLLIDGGTNIQGIDTGTKCISTCSEQTLHVFTCYNSHKYDNARWIIIAKRFY